MNIGPPNSLPAKVIYQALINANAVQQPYCHITTAVARLAIIALEKQHERHLADATAGGEERRAEPGEAGNPGHPPA